MKTVLPVIRRYAALAALAVASVQSAPAEGDNRPQNEALTASSWNAYNAEQFTEAIRLADECIKLFESDARLLQDELKGADPKTPNPKIGKVSDAERDEILSRGPLNDVATCYFIRGEACSKMALQAEGAKRVEWVLAAKKAYEQAGYFSFARTWDPRGWVWDPARTANAKIAKLPPVRM